MPNLHINAVARTASAIVFFLASQQTESLQLQGKRSALDVLKTGAIDLKNYNKLPGLVTIYTNPKDEQDILLDLKGVLACPGGCELLITAMSSKGTYTDGLGQQRILHEPLEDAVTRMLQFELASDNSSVFVKRPQLTVRTSDEEMKASVEQGANTPLISKIGVVNTTDQNGTFISATRLIEEGFFVTNVDDIIAWRAQVKAYTKNCDFSVDYIMKTGKEMTTRRQRSIVFSALALPEVPMIPRAYDDRLPYFTQDYYDMGVHIDKDQTESSDPSRDFDSEVSVIWRYNLNRLPDNQIRIYIDPTVPKIWHQSFKDGIEAWNEAFATAGYPKAVRAVLPSDEDWPKDYDAGDLRFNTINWAINTESVFSQGIAKVDPRSGEIIKSTVLMSSGWVRSWLKSAHRMTLRQTNKLSHGYRHEEHLGADRHEPQGASSASAHLDSHGEMQGIPSLLQTESTTDRNGLALKLLHEPELSLLASYSPNRSWYDIAEAGIKELVMHEVGHILGLRHNFKGTVGISYDCTQDISCTAKSGLSTSVMDYIPMNVPTNGSANVHLFSPVVGAYDKLLIQFGYMNVSDKEEKTRVPRVPKELHKLLDEASKIPHCLDGDKWDEEDPLCAAYDLTAEPVRWYQGQVKLIQDLKSEFMKKAVAEDDPYWKYGQLVQYMLEKLFSMQISLTGFIGGMNMSYIHRPSSATLREQYGGQVPAPAQPIPGDLELEALRLILLILRPRSAGFLPESAEQQFLTVLQTGSDNIKTLNLNAAVANQQELIVQKLLSGSWLKRVDLSQQFGGMDIRKYLDELVLNIMGSPDKIAWAETPEEKDLQTFFVRSLMSATESTADLTPTLYRHVALAIQKVKGIVRSGALEDKGDLMQVHLDSLMKDLKDKDSSPGLGPTSAQSRSEHGMDSKDVLPQIMRLLRDPGLSKMS